MFHIYPRGLWYFNFLTRSCENYLRLINKHQNLEIILHRNIEIFKSLTSVTLYFKNSRLLKIKRLVFTKIFHFFQFLLPENCSQLCSKSSNIRSCYLCLLFLYSDFFNEYEKVRLKEYIKVVIILMCICMFLPVDDFNLLTSTSLLYRLVFEKWLPFKLNVSLQQFTVV